MMNKKRMLSFALSALLGSAASVASAAPPAKIAVVNHSQLLADDEVARYVAAIQIQVSQHFAPVWNVDAELTFYSSGRQPEADSWICELVDKAERPMSLGYHSITASGIPFMKVFVEWSLQYGFPVSRTLSHEILEALVNPRLGATVLQETEARTGILYALEVCDPVNSTQYEIETEGGRTIVSDFVTPAFFLAQPAAGVKFDYLDVVNAPLTPARGGSLSFRRVGSLDNWLAKF